MGVCPQSSCENHELEIAMRDSMENDNVLVYLAIAVASAVLAVVVTHFVKRFTNKEHEDEVRQRDIQIQNSEKQLHLKERDFLDERNRI